MGGEIKHILYLLCLSYWVYDRRSKNKILKMFLLQPSTSLAQCSQGEVLQVKFGHNVEHFSHTEFMVYLVSSL